MTIPKVSNYPDSLDTEQNLLSAHDGLRVTLAEDYSPGDTSIQVSGSEEMMLKFPNTGFITLTEQCSDPENRAISFYYGEKTFTSFRQLEILPGFEDTAKPKRLTNVTQNVMSYYHNNIKDAVIAIQQFAGIKNKVSSRPLEGTMEERLNFLRKLAFSPRAWFSANKNIGLVPLTVEFRDLSFRLGTDGTTGEITYSWDFGDNTDLSSIITIDATSEVPSDSNNVIVRDLDGGKIKKTYTTPGIYDVKLTVKNDFGEDTVILPGLINARVQAPDEAIIDFTTRPGQILTAGTPAGGPYTTRPKIRSSTNTLIDIEVPDGVNANTDKSYSGEVLDGNNSPIDPIMQYTWSLADDLDHTNSSSTKASYSVGGIYDLILRADTKYGSYRITTYEDVIDIVEKTNLWLWNFSSGNTVKSYEFGLVSESFKQSGTTYNLERNSSFLSDHDNSTQLIREFNRNTGFTPRGTTSSGSGGVSLLYWASGRSDGASAATEEIKSVEFNGFVDTYTERSSISRPWNWISLSSNSDTYFFLGGVTSAISSNTSPTNQELDKMNLSTLSVTSSTFSSSQYKNGADELKSNVASYSGGEPTYGHFSVYRTTWKDSTGYILRNDGIGDFFRIKSFYKTSGTSTEPFVSIRKLSDMTGPTKLEGQLVTLSSGVFFFNNSGSISAYNDASGVWETGGPGVNSAAFRSLQNSNISGFDSSSQTLLAASDGDHRVYLSYDYSESSFIKFNEADLTFSSVVQRPSGTQWQMQIF